MKAGFAKVVITPPVGAPLAGFAARQDVSKGIHDELWARALALSSGEQTVVILSVDLLGLPADFVGRVRRRIAVPALVACTHTHAGPITIRTFFNPEESVDAGYMDSLAGAMEQAAAAALDRLAQARAGIGVARITDLGVNRRTQDGKPVDEEIAILRVDDERGFPRVVLVNYACHPTVLGPDNLLITGDFPATTVARIEQALGPGVSAMFVNGTQGNVGPGHSSELSAIGVIAPGRTFERAAALGGKLADAVLAALPSIETSDRLELRAASLPVELPLKRYPPPEVAAERLAAAERRVAELSAADPDYRAAKSEALYASIEHFYATETGRLEVELGGIRIGDTALIALPAEVFVEIGLRIKRAAGHRTLLAGIANGYVGYLPDRASYPAGGYEVVSSKVSEEGEDRLVEGVLNLERILFS